jgi:hypothetical protein
LSGFSQTEARVPLDREIDIEAQVSNKHIVDTKEKMEKKK